MDDYSDCGRADEQQLYLEGGGEDGAIKVLTQNCNDEV